MHANIARCDSTDRFGSKLPAAFHGVCERHVCFGSRAYQRTRIAFTKQRILYVRTFALGEIDMKAEPARRASTHQGRRNATSANRLTTSQEVPLCESLQRRFERSFVFLSSSQS